MSGNVVDPQRRGAVAKIANRMKRSQARDELSDVEFAVGRDHGAATIFRAHKYILSVSSDVFNAMFNGSRTESGADLVEIPDVFPTAFANMLSFLYTDSMEDLTLDNVYQTLYCGKRYDITQLVEACCTFLAGQLNGTNWLTHFEKAKLWDAEEAKQSCLEFVDRYSELVLRSEQFQNIENEMLMMILQRDTLTADENTIYLAAERWAAVACARANIDPTPENRRQALGAALNLIRFPMLRNAQLLDGPAKTGLLQQTELWDIYRYKHAIVKPSLPFPTKPRQGAVHRIDTFLFKDREEIFVKSGQMWKAAHVTGVSGPNLTFTWAYSQKEAVVGPANVIRATDILQRGQRVWFHYGGCYRYAAVYCAPRRPGVHTVRFFGKECGRRFFNLCFRNTEVQEWKKARLAAM